ncbi:Ldh family oxidoreductase [Streptomyces sp. NPDC014872]|uniref:Ldh family oxidoreductase n=1 Tax=Streptomyces sp. NPDC014872 TaxID=3364926 RepID=UPI0036F60463
MTTTVRQAGAPSVLVAHERLLDALTDLFTRHGLHAARARTAAEALCHGELSGFSSHGLFNLARLYLPLLKSGRCDPRAEPTTVTDLGACAVIDHRRALGLWAAAEAMDDAVARARKHGIGLVAVRGGTHFGCAGFHAGRAAAAGMVGLVASNCGGQRLVPAPRGALPLLGTNPLAVAAPALPGHPFVLDMSTTAVPTGRLRLAARHEEPVPPGWLEDEHGTSVTDPGAYDRGEARLRWLGGDPETGAYKGFGLALAVEVLAAGLSGSATGPAPQALADDEESRGTDDGIGFLLLAVDPGRLRPGDGFAEAMRELFGAVNASPPAPGTDEEVRYPGWREAERALHRRREGVPLPAWLHEELTGLGLFDAGHPLPDSPRSRNAGGERP